MLKNSPQKRALSCVIDDHRVAIAIHKPNLGEMPWADGTGQANTVARRPAKNERAADRGWSTAPCASPIGFEGGGDAGHALAEAGGHRLLPLVRHARTVRTGHR